MIRHPNLEAELARAGINKAQYALALGVSAPAMTYKLRSKSPFSYEEVKKTFELLGMEHNDNNYKYLFEVVEVDNEVLSRDGKRADA